MTLMTATRRTVTTSTMMTTTMTGMKVATTKLNISIKPDKQDKYSDIINVKIKEPNKNLEAENDESRIVDKIAVQEEVYFKTYMIMKMRMEKY